MGAMLGQGNRPGPGTGGKGGGGGLPGEAPPGETGHDPSQVTAPRHPGKMIGSFLEKGEAPAGEARLEVEEALRSSARVAEESLEKERIPAEMRRVARDYFERLNRRVQGED
jgi:hypothetical protein